MMIVFPEREELGRRYLSAIAAYEKTGIPWIGESAHFYFIAYCYGWKTAQKECLAYPPNP